MQYQITYVPISIYSDQLTTLLLYLYSFSALKSSKLLEDMATRGVKYVDCYGVDNVLVRCLVISQNVSELYLLKYFLICLITWK